MDMNGNENENENQNRILGKMTDVRYRQAGPVPHRVLRFSFFFFVVFACFTVTERVMKESCL